MVALGEAVAAGLVVVCGLVAVPVAGELVGAVVIVATGDSTGATGVIVGVTGVAVGVCTGVLTGGTVAMGVGFVVDGPHALKARQKQIKATAAGIHFQRFFMMVGCLLFFMLISVDRFCNHSSFYARRIVV